MLSMEDIAQGKARSLQLLRKAMREKTSGMYSDYMTTLERILVFDPNNMPAAYWLGQGFALGLGRPRDVEAAMRLYSKAYEQGHFGAAADLVACDLLGTDSEASARDLGRVMSEC